MQSVDLFVVGVHHAVIVGTLAAAGLLGAVVGLSAGSMVVIQLLKTIRTRT